MLGHLRSLVEGNGLFVSAVVPIMRQAILCSLLRLVRSGGDKTPACSCQPGSPSSPPCQLHRAYPASLASFAFRLDCPSSLPITSVDQNAKGYSLSPHGSRLLFPQTEQAPNRFITWAARIILRRRSFLLSINRLCASQLNRGK